MGTRRGGCAQAVFKSLGGYIALSILALAVLLPQTAVASGPTRAYLGSFGPDGTASTSFTSVRSIAVDQETGTIYVLDAQAGILYKFDEDGNPVAFGGSAPYINGNRIEGLSPYGGRGESQVAVDPSSHVIYVTESNSVRAFQEDGEPYVFSAGPGAGTNELPVEVILGVAVDANGDIYVSSWSRGEVYVFESTGALLTQFESVQGSANLAVDGAGKVYVSIWSGQTFTLTPDSFPVSPTTTYSHAEALNASPSWGVAVDPMTNGALVAEAPEGSEPRGAQYDPSGNLILTFGEGQVPNPSGIAVNGETDEAFVGANSEGPEGPQVKIFGPLVYPSLPPTIEGTSAIDITADSAELRARIDPNSNPTSYYFEFGTEDCTLGTCSPIVPADNEIAGGHDGVLVTAQLSGLSPRTTYHYRVIAENSLGTTVGPDRTFTTQLGVGDFDLADSRVWEMVSPSDKGSAFLAGSAKGVIQAGADGNSLAYLSVGSLEADPEGDRIPELASVLARRTGDSWNSKDLTPPNSRVSGAAVGSLAEYKLFTPNLTKALLEPRSGTPLSERASERTPYLAENLEAPTFTPLVTGKEGSANVPPGTEFGGDPKSVVGPVRIAGASPDFEHVVLASDVPLATGAPTPALYEWTAGQLRPLSVLPADEGETFVSAQVVGSGPGSVQGAVSNDGTRVFWSTGSYDTSEDLSSLYLRETATGETHRLDLVQAGAAGGGYDNPLFQGASADGTVVFFQDARQLTEGASPEGRDLYRCEIPQGLSPEGCASLVDISAPLPGSGESAEVQGVASGLSDSGSDISFVAKGVLDPAPNGQGETATAGEPNLYHWRKGSGVRFVVTLSSADDGPDWGVRNFSVAIGGFLSAIGSPSGRYLAFMSSRSLTGYANQDAISGKQNQEVFRYDTFADSLICVSCNPSGASPHGAVLNTAPGIAGSLIDPLDRWQGRPLAALLPEATMRNIPPAPSFYRPRTVLDNGRIYFNAFDSLVPADSNGDWDVYQYEPTGTGSCTPVSGSSTAVVRSGDACLSLISSGTAEEEAGFLDSSMSGDDVFFLSTAQLSVLDKDQISDVYDARVNGVQATISPQRECAGEACQSPATPPTDSNPASASFRGLGNVRPKCRRGRRLVRRAGKSRCVRKHHRHKHRKHHVRHSDTRSTAAGRLGR